MESSRPSTPSSLFITPEQAVVLASLENLRGEVQRNREEILTQFSALRSAVKSIMFIVVVAAFLTGFFLGMGFPQIRASPQGAFADLPSLETLKPYNPMETLQTQTQLHQPDQRSTVP